MIKSPQATARALAILIGEFPDLDLSWSAEAQDAWWKAFHVLMARAESLRSLSTPAPRPQGADAETYQEAREMRRAGSPCKKCGGQRVVETVGGEQPCDQCPQEGEAAELRRLADQMDAALDSVDSYPLILVARQGQAALRQAAARLDALEGEVQEWEANAQAHSERADRLVIELTAAEQRAERYETALRMVQTNIVLPKRIYEAVHAALAATPRQPEGQLAKRGCRDCADEAVRQGVAPGKAICPRDSLPCAPVLRGRKASDGLWRKPALRGEEETDAQ